MTDDTVFMCMQTEGMVMMIGPHV